MWQPPVELQRSAPREVDLTGTGWAASMLAIFLVVGAAGLFTLVMNARLRGVSA